MMSKESVRDMRASTVHGMAILMILTAAVIMAVLPAQGASSSSDELLKLVAPVALYPDSLLAQILPASTVPSEVNDAAQYLRARNGKVNGMPDNDWEPSVKALLQFPAVLYMMSDNRAWTRNLGNAVISGQRDVMTAIQTCRMNARNAGSLVSSSQQTVQVEGQTIYISSPDSNVIYVPRYDPSTVTGGSNGVPVLTFAAGVAVADWWHYRNVDWAHNTIIVNPVYHPYYNYHPDARYYPPPVGYREPVLWQPACRAAADRHSPSLSSGIQPGGSGSAAAGAPAHVNEPPGLPAARDMSAPVQLTPQPSTERSSRKARSFSDDEASRSTGVFDNMDCGRTDRSFSERGVQSRGGDARGGRRK